MRVAGVDGCPRGWIAAIVDTAAGSVEWALRTTAAAVVSLVDEFDLAAVAVDVPIGLPASGSRECDLLARREIAPRGCCVFPAPPREVVAETDYLRANDVSRALSGKGISKQAFFIADRIAAFDSVMTPARQRLLVECHPEVSFTLLAGAVLPPKKSPLGRSRRTDALAGWLPAAASTLASAPRPATIVDALDALVCAWTAQRWAGGIAESLPPDARRDARGLRMQIVR